MKPAVVAVELDHDRLQGLLEPPVDQLKALGGGTSSLLYRLLAVNQQKLARSYAMRPGEEMLTAVKTGWELGARVVLIDVKPKGLLRKAWRRASLKEKLRLLFELFRLQVASPEMLVAEIDSHEGDFTDPLKEFALAFPSFKPQLIDKRDHVMARRLERLMELHGSVAAVVGGGHLEGLAAQLKDHKPEIYHLKELLSAGVGQGP